MSGTSAPAPVYTQQDVIDLKTAIRAAGVAGMVRYADGSSVTYRPVAEALALLQMMERDVRAAAALAAPDSRPTRAFRGFMRSNGY